MSDWIGWDGLDGLDGLSYTAVTPRASLQSDANNYGKVKPLDPLSTFPNTILELSGNNKLPGRGR